MTKQTEHQDPPSALFDIIAPYITRSDLDPLQADADLMSLGLNSLGVVSVLSDVEDAFRIEFPIESLSMATFETPRALWSVVLGLLNCANRDPQ
jgi:acyl carrier protein